MLLCANKWLLILVIQYSIQDFCRLFTSYFDVCSCCWLCSHVSIYSKLKIWKIVSCHAHPRWYFVLFPHLSVCRPMILKHTHC